MAAAEWKYRDLVQDSNSIVLGWDCDGIVTSANEFAQSFFGYSEAEFVGMRLQGTIVPEVDSAGRDLTGLIESIRSSPETHATNVNENVLRDGRRVWIAWTNKPVCDDQGEIVGFVGVGVDVTRQKLAAEALQESQKMLQLVLDTIPARAFWKNRNLEYLGCSHLFAVDAGLSSPADIVGKTDYDMPWKNTQARNYRSDDRMVMETGVPKLGYEERQLTARGRTIWLVTSKVPLRDRDGRIIGVMGTYEDITERKRAEEALKSKEALLRQFVKHTPAAVAMFDRQMRYLLYSKRWMVDYRLGDRDITGQPHYEIFPDIPDEWKEVHRRAMAGSVESNSEDEFRRADGTVEWIRWEVHPWRNDEGEIGGIVIYSEVITERKLTEFALKESEEKYRNLVETTDTGYMVVDTEGRVMDANAEYVRLSGHNDIHQILGKSVLEWTAPYDVERKKEKLKQCLETGQIRDLEVDNITADGRVIPIEINATLLQTREGPRVLTLCRDISERKQAEDERRAYEKQMDEHVRRFYRDTILSVTDGKLEILSPEEIEPHLKDARCVIDVADYAAIGEVRHAVQEFLLDAGLPAEEAYSVILGFGEAITNAIKHAVSARVYAGTKEDSVWVAVSDKGKGMDSLILPRAVLYKGFSTKPSLGLGYCMILNVSDHVLLCTGENGTTVIMFKSLQSTEPRVPLDRIVDTWDAVGG